MPQGTETIVYSLGDGCSLSDVVVGKTYTGTVQGFANFGTFVYLNSSIKGLIHKSNVMTDHREGETILIRVGNVRDNGNIDLEEVVISSYKIQPVVCKRKSILLGGLREKIGRTVTVECQVAQVKQTSGPTIFTLIDETGSENAAGFVEAGKRAFPNADQGSLVRATGEVMQRGGQLQIELDNLEVLHGSEAEEVLNRIEKAIDDRAEPEDVPLLIQSEVLERLRPEMRKIARRIRKAIFTSQPIDQGTRFLPSISEGCYGECSAQAKGAVPVTCHRYREMTMLVMFSVKVLYRLTVCGHTSMTGAPAYIFQYIPHQLLPAWLVCRILSFREQQQWPSLHAR